MPHIASLAIKAFDILVVTLIFSALAKDGRLTGYHWGLARKAAMLGTEAARTAEAA